MHALMRLAATAAFLCGTLLLGISVGSERAQASGEAAITSDPSPDLMRALMAWTAPRLELPVPPVLPRIVRRSHCELNAIARPGVDCPDEGPSVAGVRALYSSGVLWLDTKWRSDSIRDVSFLLHELVHHMQFHAGVEPLPCAGEALEKPAYEAHFAFLESAGVDPYKVTGINALYLVFVTHCLDQR